MDNLTHSLVGLMLSRGGFHRGEKATPWMLVLAANAPDIDAYGFFTSNLTYLEVHRGYTHALAFAPAVALIPLLLVKLVTRTRITLISYLGCLAAVLTHLLLDWTNVYGVRLMLPFSAKWYRLDTTDLIDPMILGLLILSWAAPAMAALVVSEIGGRKVTGPRRGWAWFALVALVAYQTARWSAHDRAIGLIDAHNYRGAPAEHVSAFPVRFSFARWRGVVQGDGFIYEVPVDLSRDFDAAGGYYDYPAISSPAMDAARTTRTFQVFERFDQLPFWVLTPIVDTLQVELLDLRFGSVRRPGFKAIALVEHDGRIAEARFTFGEPR